MKPPSDLSGEALAFYLSIAPTLIEQGKLTALDMPSFKLLCMTWGKIKTLENDSGHERSWLELARLYNTLSRQFCLTPYERNRQSQMFNEQPAGDLDEFGIAL